MLHGYMVISSIIVAFVGLGAICLLIVWFYGWTLNYIAKIFKLHREFSSFLKQKYWTRPIKPTINKTNFKEK